MIHYDFCNQAERTLKYILFFHGFLKKDLPDEKEGFGEGVAGGFLQGEVLVGKGVLRLRVGVRGVTPEAPARTGTQDFTVASSRVSPPLV